MADTSLETCARIDAFLPTCDFAAQYGIRVSAPKSVVYNTLLRMNFGDHWFVRLLMTLRTGKLSSAGPIPGDIQQRLRGTGFFILDEIPQEELVIGVAGQFWRFDGGRCLDLAAKDFPAFSRPGFAKAAWNFRLRAESPQSTWLSTETRIQCFGPALWKFRAYWMLVGPFSGLIRKVILKQMQSQAEAVLALP